MKVRFQPSDAAMLQMESLSTGALYAFVAANESNPVASDALMEKVLAARVVLGRRERKLAAENGLA